MTDFLTQAWPFAAAVLVILGIAILVLIIVLLMRANTTMKSVQNMVEEADKQITPTLAKVDPMVEKAGLSVDALNLELLRVDGILEDVEQITSVAGKAATSVDTVTSAPANALTSVIERLRGSASSKRKDQIKQGRVVYPIESAKAARESTSEASAKDAAHEDEASLKAEELAAKVASHVDAAETHPEPPAAADADNAEKAAV